METPYPGIDVDAVTAWCSRNVEGLVAPLAFRPIVGGHSNLTYAVTDTAGNRYVLRRPPLGSILATAHDMGREWRVIHALQDSPVPVPPALAICRDETVSGAPFYVTRFVDGHVVDSPAVAEANYTLAQRRISGESLVDVLADLHAIDIDAHHLDEHGRRDGYLDRTLRRWYKQFVVSTRAEVPDIDRGYEQLLASQPVSPPATIVHGDFRLGNCITSYAGPIAAVLDWEISTLGDPLADLGYLLSTWSRPNDPVDGSDGQPGPSMAEGFPEVAELIERYSARSGRDVTNINWYLAFNHWKAGCILAGVLSRYLDGARGEVAPVELTDGFAATIRRRGSRALEILAG